MLLPALDIFGVRKWYNWDTLGPLKEAKKRGGLSAGKVRNSGGQAEAANGSQRKLYIEILGLEGSLGALESIAKERRVARLPPVLVVKLDRELQTSQKALEKAFKVQEDSTIVCKDQKFEFALPAAEAPSELQLYVYGRKTFRKERLLAYARVPLDEVMLTGEGNPVAPLTSRIGELPVHFSLALTCSS